MCVCVCVWGGGGGGEGGQGLDLWRQSCDRGVIVFFVFNRKKISQGFKGNPGFFVGIIIVLELEGCPKT